MRDNDTALVCRTMCVERSSAVLLLRHALSDVCQYYVEAVEFHQD